ncbi:MAG: hypothetical protein AAF449_17845 [Myxococcota bacterium]
MAQLPLGDSAPFAVPRNSGKEMHIISEDGGNVRIQQFSAGNLICTTDFDVEMADFDAAIATLFADENQQLSVDLPGRTLELSSHEDGVRISMWRAKNPNRTTHKVTWRDMARFLVAQ